MIVLGEDEYVIAAWAEACAGPGWHNQIVWVLLHDCTKQTHRVEALQPDEQTEALHALFHVSAACARSMRNEAITCILAGKRDGRKEG